MAKPHLCKRRKDGAPAERNELVEADAGHKVHVQGPSLQKPQMVRPQFKSMAGPPALISRAAAFERSKTSKEKGKDVRFSGPV